MRRSQANGCPPERQRGGETVAGKDGNRRGQEGLQATRSDGRTGQRSIPQRRVTAAHGARHQEGSGGRAPSRSDAQHAADLGARYALVIVFRLVFEPKMNTRRAWNGAATSPFSTGVRQDANRPPTRTPQNSSPLGRDRFLHRLSGQAAAG